MSTRIIRNIKLHNVKLIARRGNLNFNLLDGDNISISANVYRPHNITSFSSVLYSIATVESGNIDSVLKVYKPVMSVQFVEDNGVYKLFFDRDFIGTHNDNMMPGPDSNELGVILGADSAIEEEMCKKLDSLDPNGTVIYSCPSLEITSSDWKRSNLFSKPPYSIDSFFCQSNFKEYQWFAVNMSDDTTDVWVKITNDCTINVLPDNKLIFNNVDEIVDSLADIDSEPYRELLQDFTRVDLSGYLRQDATEYLSILEKRVDEAIKACESNIQHPTENNTITLEAFLKRGLGIIRSNQEERHKLWALRNMRCAIKDESFIEDILLWMLILNTKSSIDTSSITNGQRITVDGIPTLPRYMITRDHIVPYLTDIDILGCISNLINDSNIIYCNDECDDVIDYPTLISDVSRYVCESMVGITTETLNICLNSAHKLREKYISAKIGLDIDDLKKLMADYPDKTITELTDMYSSKYHYIERNLETIDKLISMLGGIINKNSDKSVISLAELHYDNSWNNFGTRVFSSKWNLLPCLNMLLIGDTHQDVMYHEFETSELRSFWRLDILHPTQPKTV